MSEFLYDLVGIGNAPIDAIAKTGNDFLEKNGLIEGALTVINKKTADDLLSQLSNVELIPGGGSANVCANLAKLGGRAAFQGRVGSKDKGDLFIQSLKDLDIETSAIMKDPENGTMFIIIPITANGERSFAAYYGATGRLGPENVDVEQISKSKAIYIEGFNLISPTSFEAYQKAVKAMKAAGGKVCFGVSDVTIIEKYKEEVPWLIEQADLVFMNEEEAYTLCQTRNMDEVLKALIARQVSAVITRGALGVYIVNAIWKKASFYMIDPLPQEQIVNMNGAGDAFTGGFLYGFLNDKGEAGCVQLGFEMARAIIQKSGPRP